MPNELEELERLELAFELSELESLESSESFTGAGIIEPALAIGSSLGSSVVSGLTGLGTSLFAGTDAGADVQRTVQSDLGSYQPTTEAGKQGMQTVAEFAKLLNMPIAGLSGLLEVATGGTLDDAVAKIDRVTEKGIGKEVGGSVIEATGSPELALVADIGSQAISDLFTGGAFVGGAKKALGGAKAAGAFSGDLIKAGAPKIIEAGKGLAKSGKELAETAINIKTPATQEIARQLKTGEINSDIARLKLGKEGIKNPTDIQKALGLDLPRVVKDKPLIKASNQGFDEGFLDVVQKTATKADKTALTKMTNWAERGRTNPLFKKKHRPSFVAGEVLMDKFKEVKAINKLSGKQIGATTKLLKDKTIDVSDIGDSLLKTFDDLKIKIVDGDSKIGYANATIDFTDALVSGAGRKKAIKDIFGRMKKNQSPDALDLHELKLFLDETISYGKSIRGLGGNAERALQELRFNIKTKLNDNFPEYASSNKAYSDTIKVLDEIQRLAGEKTDLTSNSAAGDLATLARRITSNARSRGQVMDAFESLDTILKEHASFGGAKRLTGKGGDKPPDLDLLMEYANQLDVVTGPKAKTSLMGDAESAIKAAIGTKQWMAEKAIETAKGMTGITEKNAYKSMLEFIKAQKGKTK